MDVTHLPPTTTAHGTTLYPTHTAFPDGHIIRIFTAPTANPHGRNPTRLGFISWRNPGIIHHVHLDDAGRNQDLASTLRTLALDITPHLRMPTHITPSAAAWITALTPTDRAGLNITPTEAATT